MDDRVGQMRGGSHRAVPARALRSDHGGLIALWSRDYLGIRLARDTSQEET